MGRDRCGRIELVGVAHAYDGRAVLRGVDLCLQERRIGVVGLNGSGKSTLARLLNGLVVPDSGQVLVHGLDTRTRGPAVRRKVGFVFTDADAQIVMPTVAEDVRFSLRLRHGRRADVESAVLRALADAGLQEHADHPAHLLSGGQKQMLALTTVLAVDPDVVVLDEPTTLLDARNTRAVARRIEQLEQQVVMVTHQTALLAGFDRVVVVDGGRVVADGTPREALSVYDRIAES